MTVAIVDAYNDPSVESDLGVYRSTYGLSSCTTANGCFRKVDENGGTSYPANDNLWSEEISLDVDMASAICPKCKILLVEATSNSYSDLGISVNTAVRLGANAVSNSYGGAEFNGEEGYDVSYYNHHGVAITASTGDSGYGSEYPAASPYVTAVGGTSLYRASNSRGFTESAWSGAGSGCSTYEMEPSYQVTGAMTGVCYNRGASDVSAVADPSTGVAVYDSYNFSGFGVFGGTSVSSPIIASVHALTGETIAINDSSTPYGGSTALFDATTGSNGSCGNLLCNAQAGWDGPTGLGTPNGVGAFVAQTSPKMTSNSVTGDFNGDGYTDVAALYNYGGSTSALFTFYGSSTGLQAPVVNWSSSTGAWDATRTKLVAGDFNHDGYADVAALYGYDGSTSALFTFAGSSTGLQAPAVKWTSSTGGWTWANTKLVAGDFNHDGYADVAALYDYGSSSVAMFTFAGSTTGLGASPVVNWTSSSWDWSRTKLAAGDFNRDSYADVAALYGYDGSTTALFSFAGSSSGLQAPVANWTSSSGGWTWARTQIVAGDFNGDGYADIGALYGYDGSTTALFSFAGSSSGLQAPAAKWTSCTGCWTWANNKVAAGDFNHDGYSDVAALYNYGSATTGMFSFAGGASGVGAPVQKWYSGSGGWNWVQTVIGA